MLFFQQSYVLDKPEDLDEMLLFCPEALLHSPRARWFLKTTCLGGNCRVHRWHVDYSALL